ncbi:MAG: hypothetical protein JSV81_00040 [Anaerolineales bacterium]|nr:MAG: hypothetical protein JSV81_00040 [Anaerolineales bacterium]
MKARLVLAECILAILLTGCRATQVEQMERAWLDQKITSYRIEVLVIRSIWHAQSHQVTVRDNQIESATASCIPAPIEAGKCKVETFNAEDYTVAGLFRKAHSEAESQEATPTKITYDPTYHFPQQMSYDDPNMVDEDWSWQVTAFEVLS